MKGEIKSLTSLRGFAALFVLGYHFRGEFGAAVNPDHYTQFFAKSYLWVDFFFMLSGFIISYVYGATFVDLTAKNYAKFLVRRLARIYPMHLAVLFAFVPTEAAKLVINVQAEPAFSINSGLAFLANMALVQSWGLFDHLTWNRPAWSISTEWAAYLVAPALIPLCCVWPRRTVLMMAGAIAIGFLLLMRLHGWNDLNITFDFGVLRCLLSFALGVIAYRVVSTAHRTLGSWWLAFAAALIAMLHVGYDDLLVIPVFWGLVVTTALGNGRITGSLEVAPFYWLGTVSYSVYLTHTLVLRFWQFAHQKWLPDLSLASGAFCFIGVLGGVLLISAATFHCIEVPGRRLGRLAEQIFAKSETFVVKTG